MSTTRRVLARRDHSGMWSTRARTRAHGLVVVAALVLGGVGLAACGDDDDSGAPVTLRLLTHDSFAVSDDVLAAFTEDTGIEVELIPGGDAGTVVNQAILAKGNPQADVLFGIDSTLLTRTLDEELFVPYEAADLDQVDERFLLDDEHRVTPVDYGDVCLNYDKAYFAEHPDLPVPDSLEDLVDPAYEGLLVVENPATSSPGLAFLLATVDHFGDDGWQGWWEQLRDNGVEVVDGWEAAYNQSFSGGGTSQGTKPLVVSYASSPPVEVVYADPPVTEAPTGVIDASCYRQVEAAGILRGTAHEEEAQQLVDFLLSERFQADVPLQMFVFPVREGVELPEVFVEHAATPTEPLELAPDVIAEHREAWIDEWTDLVLR
ncbi:MAG TPA: thiamine ABC transporter substrate-binding protein [Acidimicrobiales bacterium]|nr:thiamine ABC transporter substrate-binding protein [Acidimicrobiales bacterium]